MFNSYIIYNNSLLIKCACGCDGARLDRDKWGRHPKYIKGHYHRTQKYFNRKINILCACGCGNYRSSIDSNSRYTTFIRGHNNKGGKNNNWKGGKRLSKQGYIELLMPWHPNSRKDGYIFEHTFIMSRILKRPLKKGEIVHHINGIKDDNRGENLKLLENQKKHMSIHFKKDLSNRICVICRSTKTRVRKDGYINWFKKDNGYQCNKCYSKEYHKIHL